jgi:hypothetical protein
VFDLVNGIPVHPLVVHAVVVLLPLAVLGTIVIAVVPRWRVPYGPLVVAVAFVATVLIPVATSSGEALQERVGEVEHHAEMGDMLIWFAIPLLVLVTALWWLARRSGRADVDSRSTAVAVGSWASSTTLVSVVAALAVIAALGNIFQVYRVGDSGAKAVWSDQVDKSPSGG